MSSAISVVPLAYEAQLTLDPAASAYDGAISIRVRVEQPTPRVELTAQHLTLRQARAAIEAPKIEGIEAAIEPVSGSRVALRLAKPLPAGEARLWIRFAIAADGGAIIRERNERGWRIATKASLPEPALAFPCIDSAIKQAEWKLTLLLPEGMRAESNAALEWERPAVAGWHEMSFARTPPLACSEIRFTAVQKSEVRSEITERQDGRDREKLK